jgi:hypothetical protein
MKAHRALIHWSTDQVKRGLPDVSRTIDPSWVDSTSDGWSLAVDFDAPPAESGSPTPARIHFAMDEAPHSLLRPGAVLTMFERQTGQRARVEVLD